MTEAISPWDGDLLDYASYGSTFTNLVQSIDDTKVISIEAGFGHGKTFFRKAWAEHLRQAGEVVVEIDAQQSDHSGEPIITFLGAMMAVVPEKEQSKVAALAAKGGKWAGIATRAAARAILRNGAEEVIEAASGWMSEKVEGTKALEESVQELEEGMSKLAGQMIASQLAAEHARQKELPAQIDALRDALTEGRAAKRVVILIDELDRCHPDYAIALLEAMKLVFGRPGFVFCLMVNAEHLESIAHHRFGTQAAGERYLEKFVDLRLRLGATDEAIKEATKLLAMKLPLEIPFGDAEDFSVKAAAELAGDLAHGSRLTMRQIKRILERVELSMRCYRNRPMDGSLLVFLAFREAIPNDVWRNGKKQELLRRAALSEGQVDSLLTELRNMRGYGTAEGKCDSFVRTNCRELLGLPDTVYRLGKAQNGGDYDDWYKVLAGLGPRYIPEHEAMLRAVHRLMAPE